MKIPWPAAVHGQTAYLAGRLLDAGVPIIEPPGGHAIYVDAGRMLPHIRMPNSRVRRSAAALYLAGGHSMELKSDRLCSAYPDPDTGQMVYPKLELVRLAISPPGLSQSHIDYASPIPSARLAEHGASSLRGYRLAYAPPLLRHFTARFEPL